MRGAVVDFWDEAPIVTFSRDGQEVVLGRSGDAPVLHLNGSEGLGVGPVETSDSERLGGDGSITRGVRFGKREVFIPLLVEMESVRELNEWRRALNRLVAPVSGDPARSFVDITVEDPTTGSSRMIRGLYTGGLEGNFGSDYHGSWQTLGLTFECPDPWWLGPERLRTLQVAPGTKPFISQTVPFFPVVLAPSNVVGAWDIDIAGDGAVWPSWEVVGPGRDLVIESGDNRLSILGGFPSTPVLIQTRPRRVTPRERFRDLTQGSVLFPLEPGRQQIRVSLVGATPDTFVRMVFRERFLEAV